jgi:hypothetical protein
MLDEVFELVTEMFDEALHWPRRCITESANGMPFDLADDVE